MLGKKENYSAPSRAFVVVNLGAKDIVGHLSQNSLTAHFHVTRATFLEEVRTVVLDF